MRIAIVGAGAIGGWLGVRLAHAGSDVSVLARGATLAAIRDSGLKLDMNGETLVAKVQASDRAADLGPQDLIVVTVKGSALESVIAPITEMLGPQTAVLSAMNGVPWWFFHGLPADLGGVELRSIDPAGKIAAAIPAQRVIGAVVYSACSTAAPGHAVLATGNKLIFGEPNGGQSARLTAAVDAFRAAGFDVADSSRIQRDIWYKLWGNMTLNPISALTGATIDRILGDPLIGEYMLRVMAEAAEIGGRIGCPIEQSGTERQSISRKLGAVKTSMLQDAEAGRPLELDALLAAPREIAGALGVATPNMDALHGLIRLSASVRGLNARSGSL